MLFCPMQPRIARDLPPHNLAAMKLADYMPNDIELLYGLVTRMS